MNFKIIKPWVEWLVDTKVGDKTVEAKIDTGSSLTLIGKDMLEQLGINKGSISNQNYIEFKGIMGAVGQAFKVPMTNIPLGKITIPVNCVYVPFEFCENDTQYRFVTTNKYLIGTDVLNHYDIAATFNKSYISNDVRSLFLKLTPHNLGVPIPLPKEKHLSQLSVRAEELSIQWSDNSRKISEIKNTIDANSRQ